MKYLYCLVSIVLLGGNNSKDLVFSTGYEADEVTSGLEKDLPEAKDAVSRSGTVSRGGKFSICHKIANAKEYISYNAHRAESTRCTTGLRVIVKVITSVTSSACISLPTGK